MKLAGTEGRVSADATELRHVLPGWAREQRSTSGPGNISRASPFATARDGNPQSPLERTMPIRCSTALFGHRVLHHRRQGVRVRAHPDLHARPRQRRDRRRPGQGHLRTGRGLHRSGNRQARRRGHALHLHRRPGPVRGLIHPHPRPVGHPDDRQHQGRQAHRRQAGPTAPTCVSPATSRSPGTAAASWARRTTTTRSGS